MKTSAKSLPKLPPLPPDEEPELWLKAYFCGCALSGAIASQEEA
jgi:hypothetical protein